MKFQNPVLPGFYPDPSVCRVGDDYYLVTSSFEYFPGVPIFHSRDLLHWRQIGHVLTRPKQLPLRDADSSGGVYAPTLRHHGGTFYLTTTNVSGPGNFIVTAKDPAGPWSDPLAVAQEGIDPSLFFDDDGKVYYTTSRGGALQSQIDPATGKLLTEPKVVWEGTGAQHPESPHLYRIGEWYYMMIAEGGTEYCHMVSISRGKSPWGPFEPCARNPILSHRSLWSPIQGLGHADLVETPDGRWFALCLGYRPVGYTPCYHLGRETFLVPVRWHDDGFPEFGNQGRLELEMDADLKPDPEAAPPVLDKRDDFDGNEFDLKWNWLRNPDSARYSLTERPGFLRLKGSAASLNDKASPTWLGRRQCHFDMNVSARLEFKPTKAGEEAGLSLRMNEGHHYEIFLSLRSGKSSVVLRRKVGSLSAETAVAVLDKDPAGVLLAIRADRTHYRFYFGASEKTLELLGEGETRYLSTEVASGFTGVYVAMYSSGNGADCANPADFDWFDYQAGGEKE